MEQLQDWETLIAERNAMHGVVKTCLIEDPGKRNRHNQNIRREKLPRRIASHKAWAQSPAGKKSMRERGARYRATEKGKINSLKKSRAYYERHKEDPTWREHRREVQRASRARKRAKNQKENIAA